MVVVIKLLVTQLVFNIQLFFLRTLECRMISIFLTPDFSNYFEKLCFTAAIMSSIVGRNYQGLLSFQVLILPKYLKVLITLSNQSRCGQFLPVNLRNLSHVSNFVCLLLFSTKAEFPIVNQVIHLL